MVLLLEGAYLRLTQALTGTRLLFDARDLPRSCGSSFVTVEEFRGLPDATNPGFSGESGGYTLGCFLCRGTR